MLMSVWCVFTVRASSSANVDGPTFKPETEHGLLSEGAGAGGGAGASAAGIGACAVAMAGKGAGAKFNKLLPVKLGMGNSFAGRCGFCCTQLTIDGIKLVNAAATSFLQASTAALLTLATVSALFFSNASTTFSSIVT